MKRFTDTEKWFDPWYRELPPKIKLFWNYLCDRCNNAGVWKPDFKQAAFSIGEEITEAEAWSHLEHRVTKERSGWFIVKFIEFQYGKLNPQCRPHAAVLTILDTLCIPYAKGMHTLQDQDKDKDKDQDQDKDRKSTGANQPSSGAPRDESHYHLQTRVALVYLNERAAVHFREVDSNLTIISQRLREPEVTIEGVKEMIDRQVLEWKNTAMEKYLRPETLFAKSKFDGYYARRLSEIVAPTNGYAPRRKYVPNI